jgi:hypothetical protein
MVIWSIQSTMHMVDKALRLEASHPGALEALRRYLYPPSCEQWDWLSCCSFSCYEVPGSLLRIRWLMAWCPDGGRYVWGAGVWRPSIASERVLAEMPGRGDL